MVRGLERFREHFVGQERKYVLIGGTALVVSMEDAGLQARATKDLDIVLCLEALDPAFATTFWQFVELGKYTQREHGNGKREFYRFQKPGDQSFPEMLELFSRKPDMLTLAEDQRVTPIAAGEEAESLSAILLDDDYYKFLHQQKVIVQDVPIVDYLGLIALKAYAWVQLSADKEAGKQVDSKNISKHRNDVFRLFALVPPDARVEAPHKVRDNVARFLDALDPELNLIPFGLKDTKVADVIRILRTVYALV